jgi:hypothetical protein
MSVLSVTKHYRAMVIAHEQAAHRVLIQAHAQMLTALQPSLDNLYRQINETPPDIPIPLHWLYSHNRLNSVKQDVENAVNSYGQLAQVIAGQAQQQAIKLGGQTAQAQLQASVTPESNMLFDSAHPQQLAQLADATQGNSPRARTFDNYGGEAAHGVAQAIITGVSTGQSVKEIAKGVLNKLKTSLHRAVTAVGAAIMSAFRGAVQGTYQANSDVCIGWIWICEFVNSCAACIAMHGSEHGLDEELDDHVRGHCSQMPIMASGARGYDGEGADIQSGSDWFDNQDEATQMDILGSQTAYDLYNSGDITLDDFVSVNNDPVWGRSIQVTPLKELVK